MSYDKDQLKPGYQGIFVIQDHAATNRHWDLRLSFPVDSVSKALSAYTGKRPSKGVEPIPSIQDKPGKVLRSWAVPKHRLPTTKPLLAMETEDHAIQYATFKGIIPEGQYGAGSVDIYDHGTFTLNSVEYDRKYVITFNGKKVKGTYALIKTGGKKSFIWIKTKENRSCISENIRKIASAIDYVQPTLCPQIFDFFQEEPVLKDEVRKDIFETLMKTLSDNKIKNFKNWIKGFYISGSLVSYSYRSNADLDIDIIYDHKIFQESNPKIENVFEYLKDIIYENNDKKVANTSHIFSFMVLEPGDLPKGDGLYDLISNKWVKIPHKIPLNFDPDKVFILQRLVAEKIAQKIDLVTGSILRTINNLKIIDQGGKDEKRPPELEKLKILCMILNDWYEWIWTLHDGAEHQINPKFPAFDFSPNWDEKMIIFKYLSRQGYSQSISNLYDKLEDDPYLNIIDKFIPE